MDSDYVDFLHENSVVAVSEASVQIQRYSEKVDPKITYINKISKLVKSEQQINVPINRKHKTIQKANNRESARESRRRKKLYIELLEKKILALTEKKREYQDVCELQQRLLDNLRDKTERNRQQTTNQYMLLTTLENQVLTHAPDAVIDEQLGHIHNLIGPTNNERVSVINHYFKEIIENSISPEVRFAVKESPEGTSPISRHLQSNNAQLHDQYSSLLQTLFQITNTKNLIDSELNEMSSIIHDFQMELSPTQMAQMVIQTHNNGLNSITINEEESNDNIHETSLDLAQFVQRFNFTDKYNLPVRQIHDLYFKSLQLIKRV